LGKTFKKTVEKAGFKALNFDSCVYTRLTENGFSTLIVYVGDVIYATNDEDSIQPFINFLSSECQIRILQPTRFLGLNMERNKPNRQIFISQQHTTLNLLEKFGTSNCNPASTPADPNARLSAFLVPSSEGEKVDMNKIPYSSPVGALLYLANATRPDISYAVGQTAKYCASPQPAHWKVVKRIFRYLKETSDYGLWLGGSVEAVVGYTDADFCGDLDNSKSTSGSIFFLRGGPVSWSSRKQTSTATSTTHREYNALSDAGKNAVWLVRFHAEISPPKQGSLSGMTEPLPVPIHCDNQSAVKLVKNPEFHRRTKHFEITTHFIRELQEKGRGTVVEVEGVNQLADLFTKPLKEDRFVDLRERIGLGISPKEGMRESVKGDM
jgi:hypothetical protein